MIWDIPYALVGIYWYYSGIDKISSGNKIWLLIVLWVLCGISIKSFIRTICVYTRRIIIDDNSISLTGLRGNKTISFGSIKSAILSERKNLFSRTDHLLSIEDLSGGVLYLHTSTLSRSGEKDFLAFFGGKVNYEVKSDFPVI